MTRMTLTRGAAAAGAFGLAGASFFGASAAAAATTECTYPGSIEVTPDLCQVVITTDGVHTFPAALTKVSAVVVGAGGGGYASIIAAPYGGGGGEVIYVDTVALDTPITVEIGAGGTAGHFTGEFDDFPTGNIDAGDGGDTVFGAVTARGGSAPQPFDDNPSVYEAGDSGNGNSGDIFAGGGAAGDAASWNEPGPGYLLSTVPGVDADLFPAAADGGVEYGLGGIGVDQDDPTEPPAVVPNSGAGGTAFVNWGGFDGDSVGGSATGSDGVVIIRYAATEVVPAEDDDASNEEDEDALPATGTDVAGALVFGAGAAALGGGLVAAASGLRRRHGAN